MRKELTDQEILDKFKPYLHKNVEIEYASNFKVRMYVYKIEVNDWAYGVNLLSDDGLSRYADIDEKISILYSDKDFIEDINKL